jgi:predicted ester cyclase
VIAFCNAPALFVDFYNANDPAAAAALVEARVSLAFVDHAPIFGASPDKSGFAQAVAGMNQAFRQDYQVERMITEGAMRVAIWRSISIHIGPILGVLPTGKTLTVTGITAYEVTDGLITGHWEQFDALTNLTALGIFPPLGGRGETS